MNASTIDGQNRSNKILILGATGGTGKLIVKRAITLGHNVTALLRSPEKGRELHGAKLAIGDAREEAVLRRTLQGHDAVISAMGTPPSPFKQVTLLSEATRALVSAKRAERVSRLVAITGIGAGNSVGRFRF